MSKKKKSKTLSPSDNGEESSNEQDGARKHKSSSKRQHSYSRDRSTKSQEDKCSSSKSKDVHQSGRQIKQAVYKLPKDITHETHRSDCQSGEKVEGKTPSLTTEPKKPHSYSRDRSTKSHDKCSTSSKSKDVDQSGRQIKKADCKPAKDITHETHRSDRRSGEKVEGKTPSLTIEPREKGPKRRAQDREEVKRATKHPYPTSSSHSTSDKHSDGSHRLPSKPRNDTQVHLTAKPVQYRVPHKKESVHDGTSKQRDVTQVPSTAAKHPYPTSSRSTSDKHSDGSQRLTSKQRDVTHSTAKPLQYQVTPKKESVHDGTSKLKNITQVPSAAKPLQSQVPPNKEVSAIRKATLGTTRGPCMEAPNLSVHDGTSKQSYVTQVPSTAKPLQSQVPPKEESVHDGTSKQSYVTQVPSTAKPLQSRVPPKEESVHDGTSKQNNVTQVPSTAEPLQSQVPPKKESVHDGTSKHRNGTQVPSTAKPLQSQVPPKEEVSAIRKATPGTTCGPPVEAPNLAREKCITLSDGCVQWCNPELPLPPERKVTQSVHEATSEQSHVTQVSSTAEPLQSPVQSVHDVTQIYDNDIEMQVVEELLHEARSKDSLRLMDSYGELTSMDLSTEPSVEVATEGPGLPQVRTIIAMDTNILLSHLEFVKKIMSHGLGAMGFPVILIPWVVLQELDSLKNGRKLRECVARLACPAVHFIYTSLKKQDPGVWGQSMQQASQSCQDLTTYNNDDRVLQCCLQYQSFYPESALFLCTNDKNLCSKSLFSGVKALSKTDLEEEAKTHRHSPHPTPEVRDGRRPTVHTQATAPSYVEPLNEVQENERGEEREKRTTELSNCVSLMEDCLKEALSAILEAEMKAAFDHLWLEIVCEKPPWSLEAVLKCFSKHWIAVFGNIVPRHLQQNVKNLIVFFSSATTVDCSSTMLVALYEAKSLLEDFQHRSTYGSCIPTTLSSLDGIIRKLQPQQPEVSHPHENVAARVSHQHENSPTPMENSHQDVWTLFEELWFRCEDLCSQVFQALHFDPNSMQVNWPQGCPPPPHEKLIMEGAWAKLHQLSSVVTQLIQAFLRVLSPNSGLEETQALHTLIYTGILDRDAKFTAMDLLDCFAQQEYREKLRIGGTQLMELKASLERCVEVCQHRTDTIMVSTMHDF